MHRKKNITYKLFFLLMITKPPLKTATNAVLERLQFSYLINDLNER